MAHVALPAAYRGDPYTFTMRFPDASYLTGAPGNVLAQIRTSLNAATVVAVWEVNVVNDTDLVLSMTPMLLKARRYVTDVQVGDVTYLKAATFTVNQDVSHV